MNYLHRALSTVGFILLVVPMSLGISSATATQAGFSITIGTFWPHYSPNLAKIQSGTTISWENPTATLHSITHDGCQTGEQCAFDSGPLGPRRTFTLDALPPGSYPYHCSFHPIMRGVLVVLESGGASET